MVPISLERFLVTDFKDKEIFILKLSGLTLQEIGDRYNITRERVRQRLKKVLSKLPLISEIEEYKDVFCKYEITKDLFERVFNADDRVYELLNLVCKKGKLDFADYIINNDFDSEIKDFVLRKKRKIQISDKVRRATKINALEEVLKDNIDTQAYFTPEEIWYLYNEYVKDYQSLRISNLRSLLALADRSLH
ncbi:TPA: sigma factor-like helix-turn-helix DNA-binding protein, partial [Streptococcus suis]